MKMTERVSMGVLGCLAILLAVTLAGCSGVILSADYSRLLDQTAALSAETARRADLPESDALGLTRADMAAALRYQAEVWLKLRDARDGKADKTKAATAESAEGAEKAVEGR